MTSKTYTSTVDVTVTDLRSHLHEWLAAARGGEEVVITERGVPVARLVGVDSSDLIERLTHDGLLSPPPSPRRRKAARRSRVRATPGPPLSEVISEMRR
jgi:prevent-host-death family protein